MRTQSVSASDADRSWYVVDATNVPLGRLASHVASVLRGKNKPSYTPHADTGDFVVVINAEKVRLTGRKLHQKKWFHHSGYPGGIKAERYEDLIERRPAFIIEKAVKGMLPKTTPGRRALKHLKVYAGETHPHAAQKPQPLTF
ncbi:MAG: 50S ribosomal protein L13 [Myxococcota bacterium]